jgi:hypothetical protein
LIYAEIFERISLLKNEILEMIHLQQLQFNESVAEATQLKAYNYYKKTIIFIEMNKLVTDKNIYNQIWDLTQNFGTEILFFQGYIHNMKKYIAKEPAALKDYSPTKKMDETAKNFKKLSEDYKNISEVLANKVWWLTQD